MSSSRKSAAWTAHPEAEHAFVKYLRHCVPAQTADGATSKRVNLSESAALSSINVTVPLKDPANPASTITAFPGDPVNVAMAVTGNKVVPPKDRGPGTGDSPRAYLFVLAGRPAHCRRSRPAAAAPPACRAG